MLWQTYFFFFKILFIHSWETQERERQRHRQREKQALCREPDIGFNPRSPGSSPGLKAALNRWATQVALQNRLLQENFLYNIKSVNFIQAQWLLSRTGETTLIYKIFIICTNHINISRRINRAAGLKKILKFYLQPKTTSL